MKKLPEVETARALMMEAMKWSVMRWLREKKTVRKTADRANAALDQMSDEVKQRWPESLKAAYGALVAPSNGGRSAEGDWRKTPASGSNEVSLFAKKVKDADDKAYRARVDAEETFDKAERQLSTSLAREGCQKAIDSWELKEKAIHKAAHILP
jgi:hypothetical protein